MIEYGGVTWQVRTADVAVLRGWLERHWAAASGGGDHVVKGDRGGHVAIVDGLVLKVYRRRAGAGGWLAGCLRSRARRAFRAAQRLTGLGLPVPQPVAWAVIRHGGSIRREYLVTREVPDAHLLQHWMARAELPAPTRESIVTQLGALLGGFHRAGVTNRDFKDGNTLVAESKTGVTVTAIDMDGVRRAWRTGHRLVRRDLMPVVNSLALYEWDTPDALRRLLAAYNAAAGTSYGDRVLPRPSDTPDPAAPGWNRRRRRVRQTGCGMRTLTIHTPSEEPHWNTLGLCFWQGRLTGLEAVCASPEAIVHVGGVAASPRRFYFKRFLMRSPADRVKHLIRRSRAWRAWQGGALLVRHGLPAPRTVCVVEERVYGMVRGSGLVTEAVADAVPLDGLLGGESGGTLAGPARRTVLRALAREVARMHAAGLVHGDMRHGNILCVGQPEDMQFYWLDNERTRPSHRLHERARNLVQLNMLAPGTLSRTDRLRFWQAYREARGLAEADTARLLRHVLAWTQRRWHARGW